MGRTSRRLEGTEGVAADARGPRTTRDPSLSVGARRADECRLVQSDNLVAMRELERTHGARFRLAYLDPPFNTGRVFSQYDDARSREAWLAMMAPRLHAARALLRDDGVLAVEIDDTELGPLQVLCDEIFGSRNRVSTITVVRSAATGHKAQNAGPVHVSDFILLYAKSRAAFSPTRLFRERAGADPAYRTFIVDRGAPVASWRYVPLARAVAAHAGFATGSAAKRSLGEAWPARQAAFARAHAASVVRFAQVRVEAVSREAQALVARSRREPDRTLVLERPSRPALVLRGGNRVLFLASKLRSLLPDGTLDPTEAAPRVLAEPLTNVWTDVPFQGLASEGGVAFSRNKKPERLLERLLALTTAPGDWVLDPFLGSGTTAAVAETMGRRWIGIEQGDHALSLALPRLARLARGEDATGLRRSREYTGGGTFGVYR